MYDYIIVGAGLAGIAFAQIAILDNKKIAVFDDSSLKASSEAAAGVFNPIIFKRYTLTENAIEQLELLNKFYRQIEVQLNQKLLYKVDSLKKMNSLEDQNIFLERSDRPLFAHFLEKIIRNQNNSIVAPYGLGLVRQTGYIDVKLLLTSYKDFLKKEACFFDTSFDYSNLRIEDGNIYYGDIVAKNIIFCEGYNLKKNPFFADELPLDGVKGEVLEIYSEEMYLDKLLKGSIFILPTKQNHYLVGATYNWEDKTDVPTLKGKQYLEQELSKYITCSYKIVNHYAGIRPTVKDRLPLLGRHQQYSNMYILNGMGTRGVMNSPYYAQLLYDFITKGIPLDTRINIERFRRK
ncbi:MAG: FAD-binding oxidoreductase [Bacteroidota bacterium]|nr:FAD-binding oxidoreductase [Bacteroidota bacterium]